MLPPLADPHRREALMEGRCQPTPARLKPREACPRVGPVPHSSPRSSLRRRIPQTARGGITAALH